MNSGSSSPQTSAAVTRGGPSVCSSAFPVRHKKNDPGRVTFYNLSTTEIMIHNHAEVYATIISPYARLYLNNHGALFGTYAGQQVALPSLAATLPQSAAAVSAPTPIQAQAVQPTAAPARGARLPAAAWDDRGRDVIPELRDADRRFVQSFDNAAFKGFARLHTLELDLGALDTRGPVRLLMRGLTDYFTATSMFAALQANVSAIAPYVEAERTDGSWVRVAECSPGLASTSSPPARYTISGTQCPAANTGSVHSIMATRGRGARAALSVSCSLRVIRALRSSPGAGGSSGASGSST